MQLTRILAALAAFTAMALLAAATPASAQATRTWVSGVGDDANPCSRTAPCKTFAGAIGKTTTGGEINCLDPGGFGTLTITKAITIDCSSTLGGVLAATVVGINVSIVPGTGIDTHVQLIGLHFDGVGTGTQGIQINVADNVLIQNCVIYGFRGGSTASGVILRATGAHVMIENSVIRLNNVGVTVAASGATAQIENTLLDANINANLAMTSTGGKAFLNRDTLTESAAITNSVTPAAAVISTGTNFISGTGAPTSTQALQ